MKAEDVTATLEMVLEAVAPLGKEYVDALAYGLDHRWMDTYPRPRKQSGAHMDGYAYDVHPYVLMNYNDDYESVTTMAHEWGHAMHSYLANRAQPFVTSNYTTFIAEIASTFNEELLLQQALKTAKTDDERLFYLGSALEQLRGTFFRQAMFAEFERSVHARADKGEPLSGDAFTKVYCDILKRYHGASEASWRSTMPTAWSGRTSHSSTVRTTSTSTRRRSPRARSSPSWSGRASRALSSAILTS
jgi:oligoendopeptidase F